MKIETFKPKSDKLQKYIESFYILEHSKNEKRVSYLTFPSVFSIVATVLNAENIVSSEHIITKSCISKQLETSLVCRFNKPICFQYVGNIKEVCIYFKPLGLNAFLEKPLEAYSSSYFDPFVPFSDYENRIKTIMEIEDKTELIENIELYWLNKLIGFEHPFLSKAIYEIEENFNVKTSDLANTYKVSQKTFIKHFKTHLCKTPTEYKKIVRFRKALTAMQNSNKKIKLTDLSYITDFFDQSHMVSNFKLLTGFSPKTFFKNLSTVEKGKIYWIFK